MPEHNKLRTTPNNGNKIAYKKDCLEKVLQHLTQWKNEELVLKALHEIIDVHHRYRNFSFYSQARTMDANKIFKEISRKICIT
ncbi:MAG: hypothetical protein QM768_14930 [Agriterribacter sp.]